jgi:hypothetical protein
MLSHRGGVAPARRGEALPARTSWPAAEVSMEGRASAM